MFELDWFFCNGEIWCDLNRVDLDHKLIRSVQGIYMIWYEKPEKTIVTVGYGKIAAELQSNIDDLAVQAFKKYDLKVSWAEASKGNCKKAYAYFVAKYNPKIVDDNIQKGKPMESESPWDMLE